VCLVAFTVGISHNVATKVRSFVHCRKFVSSQTKQFCRCVYELF
jgi:hypothetical protein